MTKEQWEAALAQVARGMIEECRERLLDYVEDDSPTEEELNDAVEDLAEQMVEDVADTILEHVRRQLG